MRLGTNDYESATSRSRGARVPGVALLRHWGRVLEAAAQLTRASLELRLAQSARAARLLGDLHTDVGVEEVDGVQLYEAQCVGYAVMRAVRWLPWHPTCLRQAIAVQRMLRRRDIPSRLQLGISKASVGEAHAWVTVQGQPIIQAAELERFVPLAGFE